MQSLLYYLGLAFLFTHELDAMTHAEWRLLLVLGDLPDPTASVWFVALHVPLFFAILWLSQHPGPRVQNLTRIVVAAFLCVHAVLHVALSSRPESGFDGPLSVTLIAGAGLFGLASLTAQWAAARGAAG